MNILNRSDSRRFFEIYLEDELVAKFKILRNDADNFYAHQIEELLLAETKQIEEYLLTTSRQIDFVKTQKTEARYCYKFIFRDCAESQKAVDTLIHKALAAIRLFSEEFKESFRYMTYNVIV